MIHLIYGLNLAHLLNSKKYMNYFKLLKKIFYFKNMKFYMCVVYKNKLI